MYTEYQVTVFPPEYSMEGDTYYFDWVFYHLSTDCTTLDEAQKVAAAFKKYGLGVKITKVSTTKEKMEVA